MTMNKNSILNEVKYKNVKIIRMNGQSFEKGDMSPKDEQELQKYDPKMSYIPRHKRKTIQGNSAQGTSLPVNKVNENAQPINPSQDKTTRQVIIKGKKDKKIPIIIGTAALSLLTIILGLPLIINENQLETKEAQYKVKKSESLELVNLEQFKLDQKVKEETPVYKGSLSISGENIVSKEEISFENVEVPKTLNEPLISERKASETNSQAQEISEENGKKRDTVLEPITVNTLPQKEGLTLTQNGTTVTQDKDEDSFDSLIEKINKKTEIEVDKNASSEKEAIEKQPSLVQPEKEKTIGRVETQELIKKNENVDLLTAQTLSFSQETNPSSNPASEKTEEVNITSSNTAVVENVGAVETDNKTKETLNNDKPFFEISSLISNSLEEKEEEFKRKQELLELEMAKLKLEQSKKPRYDPSEWINITILKDANKYDQFGTWVEVKSRNKY